jgi:predicted aspartyl protease
VRGPNSCLFSFLMVLLIAGEPTARGYTDGHAVKFDLYRDYLIVGTGSAGPLKGLNFLLDTGASPTVLDRRLAQKLHLQELPAKVAVLEGSVLAGQAMVPSLEFGPIRRDNFNVLIQDLSFVQKALPIRIDAVVGLDVLGQSPFEIDYTSREIRFGWFPPLACSLPLRIRAGLPVVDAELNHFSVHLLVDTGESSLILFKARTQPVSPVKIGSVQPRTNTSGEFDRKLVRLQSVRIGEAEFGDKPAFLVPSRSDEVKDDFDGSIGPAALGITKIAIDLGRGVLAFSR